eukprot:scpid14494/ scgid25580/ Protein bicaudal C homolog 1
MASSSSLPPPLQAAGGNRSEIAGEHGLHTHALVSGMGGGDGEGGGGQDGQAEERFRVDRRKLEMMIANSATGAHDRSRMPWKGGGGYGEAAATVAATTEESGEQFFQRIMKQTNTIITWPCKLKIGAKSKKDPHVKVRGAASDVARAKELIVAVLDTKASRVALKMDVPHTEHSHVIGKGGANIRSIMEETNCHIHFPDCSGSERRAYAEKSSQVSITGQPECVDIARQRIRAILPLVFSFELPPDTDPDSTAPHIQQILTAHNVSISFRTRSRSSVLFCQVRGCQYQERDVVDATEKLWEQWKGPTADCAGKPLVLVTSTMDVAPQHHSALRGRSNSNYKQIEKETGVHVVFPSSGTSSSIMLSGNAMAVCTARRMFIDHLPLLLMFDVPEEKGLSASALSSIADSLAENSDVHVSITPKAKQTSHSVKIKGSEGKAQQLYDARRALLQLDRKSSAQSPLRKLTSSQLLQSLQAQPLADAGNSVDLRPAAGSLSLSWSAQQLQMESSNRSNSSQTAADLQPFQFQRGFNEDIFRSDNGDRLALGSLPSATSLKISGLSDSFGHSSDNGEHGASSSAHRGPPPGIHTPPRFSPRRTPSESPAKPATSTALTGSALNNSAGRRTMMDALAKLPQAKDQHAMVKSSSLDSQLSSKFSAAAGQGTHPATRLQAAVDRGTALSRQSQQQSVTALSSSSTQSATMLETVTGSSNVNTVPADYDVLRQKAAKAIQEGRHLTTEVVRTPTDLWTGHGFSKSSPEHVLREQLAQQPKFNPSMATMYETENVTGMTTMYEADDGTAAGSALGDGKDGGGDQQEVDELMPGSIPVPTDSTVKQSHFHPTSSAQQIPTKTQAAMTASFGSIGDSPSKNRPLNQTEVNWSLWQTWQRTADQAETGAAGKPESKAPAAGSTFWSAEQVRDLSSLLSLLDLKKVPSDV